MCQYSTQDAELHSALDAAFVHEQCLLSAPQKEKATAIEGIYRFVTTALSVADHQQCWLTALQEASLDCTGGICFASSLTLCC